MAKKSKASKKRRKNLSKKNRNKRSSDEMTYEALEPRQLLATVTSTADNTIPNDGLTTLREAIISTNASAADNTINFSSALANSTIELSQGELNVFDDLTINGNGVTIDADRRSRVLNITPDSSEDDGSQSPGDHNVTLNNLTLTNGTPGGEILLEEFFPDVVLEFARNNSRFSGGAIRANSTGTLTLSNSTVSNSFTNVFNASGGGIFSVGPVELTNNSLVEGNETGSRFSGASLVSSLFGAGPFVIYNALARNHVGDLAKGGGVYSQDRVTVDNSDVRGNQTYGGNASGGGIAAINRIDILNGSVIENNETNGKLALGGGVYAGGGLLDGNLGVVNVDNSTVQNNKTTVRFSKGGGIAGDLVFVKNNSTITGNRTTGKQADGGGIYAQGHVTIDNSTLSNNHTVGGVTQLGEVACLIAMEVAKEVVGHFIPGGKALDAAQYAYQAFGYINDLYAAQGSGEPLLDLNPCPEAYNSGGAGGGVMARSIHVYGSTIDGNTTDGDGGHGGGLYSRGRLNITDSTISNNQTMAVNSVGGGLSGRDVNIIRSTIEGNSTLGTRSGGGAITGLNIQVTDSTVTGNSAADSEGGAIWTRFSDEIQFKRGGGKSESVLEITRSHFSSNETTGSGFGREGGAISSQGTVFVEDSVFNANRTTGTTGATYGGAIWANTILSTGSTFDSNFTESDGGHGGAIFAFREARIVRSTFVGNETRNANANGGALAFYGYSDLQNPFGISSSTIADNIAGNKGGGVSSWGGLALLDSIVLGNVANNNAGDASTGRGNNLWVNKVPNSQGGPFVRSGQNIGSRPGQYSNDVHFETSSGPALILTNMSDVFDAPSNLLDDNAGKLAGRPGNTVVIETAELKSGTSNPAVDVTGLPQNELDQRGFNVGVKIKSGAVNLSDLGASELQPLTLVNTTSLNPSAGNTLAEAIIFANSTPDTTDTIRFAPSLAGLTISLTTDLPDITASLNIDGSVGGQRMTIDGLDQRQIFSFFNADDLKLNDLLLRRGKTTASGGAINFFSTGNLALRNTIVSDSEAEIKGGAIAAFLGTVTLTDSFVLSNKTTGAQFGQGGGINAKNVKLYNSQVLSNVAQSNHGGGIYATNQIEVRNNSVVNNNTATGNHYGGGVYSKIDVLIENSTLENNTAEQGGGVFAVGKVTGTNAEIKNNNVISAIAGKGGGIKAGSVELTNSVVTGNKAMGLGDGTGSGKGGGIYASSSTIRNSTITFNNSIGDGGGLFIQSGNVNISNTIIASNGTSGSNGDGGGVHHNGGGSGDTLEITNSTIAGNSVGSGFANGGGIFSNTNVDLDITNSIVVGNFTKRVAGGPENEIKSFGPLNFHGKNIVGEDSADFNASAPNVINAPAPVAGEFSSVFQDAEPAGFDSDGDGIFDDFSSGHFTGTLVEHDNDVDNGVLSIRLNTSSNNPAINGTDAPVSLFSFEGNTDDGFDVNNGTAIGGLQVDAAGQRGVSSTAVQFTGDATQFIELDSPLTIGNISNTVELWVNIPVDAPSSFMTLLGSNGANWGINNAGRVHFFGFGGIQVDGSTNLRDGNWHHLAFVRDNTAGSNSIQIFVDGELDISNTSANSNVAFTSQPRIGLHAGNVDPLTGLVDELTIHESALSQEEIRVRASFDVRGNDRVTSAPGTSEPAILDLGAYESASAVDSLTVTTLEDIVDPNDKFTSIREAIAFAETGDADGVNGDHDVIDFAPELGVGAIVLTGGQLEVTEALTIAASSTGRITIDALGNSRILSFDSTTGDDLELENLTLTGGKALGAFGTGGGAIRFGSTGVLTLRGTQVSNSQARIGGGIQSNLGDVVLENSLIFGNSATPSGTNSPTHGGGVSTETGDITAINSIIYGNQALGPVNKEAGLYGGGTVTLENSAVLFNRNEDAGLGGIVYAGGVFSRFSPTITNSIILGNNLNQYAEIRTEQSQSLIFAGHNIVGENQAAFDTTGLTNVQNAKSSEVFYRGGELREYDDPNLLPTLELFRVASNPALDSGDNSLVTSTTDIHGNARLVDIAGVTNGLGTVDLGPIEAQSDFEEHRSVIVTTSLDVIDPFDYETSLREAIEFTDDVEAGPLRNGDADGDGFDRDTVTFAEGPGAHFSVPRTITQTGTGQDSGDLLEFKSISGLAIDGPSAELTIDANQTGRIFSFGTDLFVGETTEFAGGQFFSLKDLTLVNGHDDFQGGAIHVGNPGASQQDVEPQSLTLTNVVIRDSFAGERGGGILAENAFVTMHNSALVNNSTGGASYNNETGGSAIYFNNSFGQIFDSTISGNESFLGYGALMVNLSDTETSVLFGNSTIANNTGFGVQTNSFAAGDEVFLTWGNTIIADNSNGNLDVSGPGDFTQFVFNSISDDATTAFGLFNNSFDNTDPLLSPLSTATWTHGLKLGSPAIDTGTEQSIFANLHAGIGATANTPNDFRPVINVINNSAIREANFLSTQETNAESWVTDSVGPATSDYFENGGVVPILEFDLNSTTHLFEEVAIWGYTEAAVNDIKTFTLEFSFDGGESYFASVELEKPIYSSTDFVHVLPLGGKFSANYIRMTITDNYGGNRVGFNEIRFIEKNTDQRGENRIVDGDGNADARIDIGAFEARSTPVTFVVDDANDVVDGDFSAGNLSLREAVELANQDSGAVDQITFDPGVGQTIDVDSELVITSSLDIIGLGANQLTLSGGPGGHRLFSIDDGNGANDIDVTIRGITIADGGDGTANVSGAGINSVENLTLTGVTLTNNQTGPEALGGGLKQSFGSLVVQDSTFSGNGAKYGGGIYTNFSTVEIMNSTFSGNTALNFGGGISNNSNTTIRNSTFTGNRADFDANGSGNGGGINTFPNKLTLHNSIVAGNYRASSANEFNGNVSTVGTPSSNNLIGHSASAGGLADGTNGNVVGNNGSGTININSILDTTLALNGGTTATHALASTSPAIDAGDSSLAVDENGSQLLNDQRGLEFSREVDGNGDGTATIDIGAFEFRKPIVVDVFGDVDDGNVTQGNLSISEAVRLSNTVPGRDVITFDPTVFVDGDTIVLTSTLEVSEEVTVSGFTDRMLSISGDSNRIFNLQTTTDADTYTFENIGLIDGDSAGTGGAIRLSDNNDNLIIDGVQFENNSAIGGGAIFVGGSDYLIKNSTFVGNDSSFSGSAILAFATAEGLIINSTFSDNTSGSGAGSVYLQTTGTDVATMKIINSTIAFSSRGVQAFGNGASSATIEIGNSIVSNNVKPNATFSGNGTIVSLGNNISDDNSVAFSETSDLTNTNPLLDVIGDNGGHTSTHGLLPGSPATDAGNNALAVDGNGGQLANDQRGDGFDRIIDGNLDTTATVDVGAVEKQAGSSSITFVVDVFGDIDNGNFSAGDLSIREAVKLANLSPGDDTITFDSGVFADGSVIELNASLVVDESVTIMGFTDKLLSISGVVLNSSNTPNRIFSLGSASSAATYKFENIGLINGGTSSTGGAIRLSDNNDDLIVDGVLFGHNFANGGGAIFVNGADYLIKNSAFISNATNFSGAAILAFGNTDGLIVNSTFSDNTSGSGAGSIFVQTTGADVATAKIINSTIAFSSRGIQALATGSGSSTIEIGNSIVSNNVKPNATFSGTNVDIVSLGNNVSDDNSVSFDAATDLINTNPQLDAIGDNGGQTPTHALLPASPATDAGNNALAVDENGSPLGSDQRGSGFDRIIDGNLDLSAVIDAGAFEKQTGAVPTLVVDTFGDAEDGNVSVGNLSIREAVTLANSLPGHNQITFDTAVFSDGDSINLTSSLVVNDSVTFTGFANKMIFVNGFDTNTNTSSRIFNLGSSSSAATFTFENIGLINGNSSGTGGAIRLSDNDDNLVLDGVFMGNNTGNGGGAIFVGGSDYLIKNSAFIGNASNFSGPAILAFGDADGLIVNSTFSDNISGSTAGSLFLQTTGTDTATMKIINSTIAFSSRGVQATSSGTSSAIIEIGNSIVSDNVKANATFSGGNADVVSLGNNVSDDTSASFDAASDLTNTNPLLDDLADNNGPTPTHALLPGSPALDAGNNALAVDENGLPLDDDQRGTGFDRVIDGNLDTTATVDVGAFEQQTGSSSLTFVVDIFGDADDGNFTTGNLSIREAVFLANNTLGHNTIEFDANAFPNLSTIHLTSELVVTDAVTITGFADRAFAISGEDQTTNLKSRIFNLGSSSTAATFTIENLFLRGASVAGTGGAIRLVDNDDTLVLDGVQFIENNANGGGAIFVNGADYLIKNSTFASNTSNFSGAAILAYGETDGLIYNSTFFNNDTGSNAGAIFLQTANADVATMKILNATIDSNDRGIQVSSSGTSAATVEIGNSIVSNSLTSNATASGTNSSIVSLGNNLSDDTSAAFNAATDMTNTDPLLDIIAPNGGPTPTMSLGAGSPAIDAGNNALAVDENGNTLLNDQRKGGFLRFEDGDSNGSATIDIGAFEVQSSTQRAAGSDRFVFYKDSSLDGSGISNAIAPDKSVLRSGQTATFENYTSFVHGINGLVVDLTGANADRVSESDFEFKFGNVDEVNTWTTITPNVEVSVVKGEAGSNVNRVVLEFENGAITNGWLQVRVLANANTGLAADDVFYFGNAIGEAGNNVADAIVNLADVGSARANQTGFGTTDIMSVFDFNRDQRVNLADIGIVRANQSGFNPLKLITPTEVASGRSGDDGKGKDEGGQQSLRLVNNGGLSLKGVSKGVELEANRMAGPMARFIGDRLGGMGDQENAMQTPPVVEHAKAPVGFQGEVSNDDLFDNAFEELGFASSEAAEEVSLGEVDALFEGDLMMGL